MIFTKGGGVVTETNIGRDADYTQIKPDDTKGLAVSHFIVKTADLEHQGRSQQQGNNIER
jgi:hypothetical protein